MRIRTLLPTGVAAVALAVPAGAAAHVTVQPPEAVGGGHAVISLRVPNESDEAGTTKVDVKFPPGFVSASYQKIPGWKARVVRTEKNPPVTIEGVEVTDQVDRVVFTASGRSAAIAPGQFQDFPLSVRIPEGKAGSKLTFKAVQTYSDGEIARWIGAADADKPAPQLTLVEGDAHGDGHEAGGDDVAESADHDDRAEAAASTSDAEDDDGPSTGLVIVALVLGAGGLLAGGAGLLAARRAG